MCEDKGYIYGVGSYFVSNCEIGVIVFNVLVCVDVIVEVI